MVQPFNPEGTTKSGDFVMVLKFGCVGLEIPAFPGEWDQFQLLKGVTLEGLSESLHIFVSYNCCAHPHSELLSFGLHVDQMNGDKSGSMSINVVLKPLLQFILVGVDRIFVGNMECNSAGGFQKFGELQAAFSTFQPLLCMRIGSKLLQVWGQHITSNITEPPQGLVLMSMKDLKSLLSRLAMTLT